jgi:hypothetical protein
VLREGNNDYLVHHFYDRDAGGRHTLQIRPIIWGKDGWPLAGEPGPSPRAKKVQITSVTGRWHHSVNFDPTGEISLLPGGAINSLDTKATWRLGGSMLTLR